VVDLQPVRRQIVPDSCKELLAKLVGFQEMAELADCGLIGDRLTAQINPDKLPHGARVVQRFFDRRI